MQPKRISEFTPITNLDGDELIPVVQNGQNEVAEARHLPVSDPTQAALALLSAETGDTIEDFKNDVNDQVNALSTDMVHKTGDQTIEGEITFAAPALFPNGFVLTDLNGVSRRYFSATNGALDFETYTPPVIPPEPGTEVTAYMPLGALLSIQGRRRYVPPTNSARRRGPMGVLLGVR